MSGRPTRGADKVISNISAQLANGTLKPGDKLPAEARLCEEYGVSRTVVREAIQQLKAIGVVNTIVGSGSYITEANLDAMKNSIEFFSIMTGDPNSWLEMLELRILLESNCAKKVAGESFTEKGLNKIKAELKKMKDSQHDIKLFAEADVRFHKTLIEASGNSMFTAVLQSLENLQLRFSKETYREENGELLVQRNYNAHLAIVDAIEARDPLSAEKAMTLHLSETMKNLQFYIKKRS